MFAHKFIICTTLLLLSTSVLSQKLYSLKNADIPEQEKPLTSSSSSSSTSTTTTSTTTTTTMPNPPITSSSTTTTTTTTIKPPTTSTTAAPTTSTTPAPVPTTTHKPQPYPAPSMGSWNSSCILLNMAAQLNFTYETIDGNMTTGLFNVPTDAKVDHSICDSQTSQSMQLNWGPAALPEFIALQLDNKNKSISLTSVQMQITVSTKDYPDAKENQTVYFIRTSQNSDFKTPEKMSYHCTRVQKFNMTETLNHNETMATISFSHVQVEAFRPNNTTGFSAVHDCDSSETSDVVPIAVGIALAALIMVVLISYLCARRRSTSRGYMSF
ncbi:lysosome-associated membrane glycoprotein 1 [Drosophila grimshawi]|uniref:Lysosome-associated membrane glycoprotein 5 n=1 Tax=Drosophila grimshawi TaxID=7222 RepID=B4JQA1_DROGR|nr:lysosome-associated membrane glycoprotein 1 [Drosophila grimshawi]EDV99081.1 GH13233 [Drosophila grimshawi]